MWSGVPVGQFQVHVKVNRSEGDNDCQAVQDFVHARRYIDLCVATVGLIFAVLHLLLLLYIRYALRRRGFFLLLVQACSSIVALVLVIFGSLIDLCVFRINLVGVVVRAHLLSYFQNAMVAAYGFLTLSLCVDRYVALTNPLYFRLTFTQLRTRLLISLMCIFMGMLCATRWLPFHRIVSEYDFEENELVTDSAWYMTLRTISILLEYFSTGISMILISYKNLSRLRELDSGYYGEVRLSAKGRWTKKQTATVRICLFLAVAFVVCNWPYAVVDYLYTDDLAETVWYGVVQIVVNTVQVIYLQLNLFLFAYCSHSYRAALRRLNAWCSQKLRRRVCYQRLSWNCEMIR